MYATIVEIDRLEFSKVKYFSVFIEGRDHSEFLNFQHRMRTSHPTQLGELNTFIKEIGNVYGAAQHHFRDERQAEALPPEYFDFAADDENPTNVYGLRLYCLRLNDSVVILFNGDLKTTQKASGCPNCKKHFDMANRLTASIHQAIVDKFIRAGEKQIIGLEEFEIEI